jgi:hypothetical protein
MNLRAIRKENKRTNTFEEKFEKGYRFIKNKTMSQRDEYYDSVVTWNKGETKRKLEETQKSLEKLSEVDGTWKKSQLEQRIVHLTKKEENANYNVETLNWLLSAQEYFDGKLKNVTNKLVGFGFCDLRSEMEVVDVSDNHSRGLDFYINCTKWSYSETETQFGGPKRIYENVGRAHARLVWVNCYDKASHWRFICTLKK